MKRTCSSLLLLLLVLFTIEAGAHTFRPFFAEKDIFQTAYFLRNAPGLIPDCEGRPIRYYAEHDGICVYLTDEGPIYRLAQKDEKIARGKPERRSTITDQAPLAKTTM